jgi:hypothetical protein
VKRVYGAYGSTICGKFALLRFNNQWHYLFAEGPNVSAVLVTVSCNHQDHSCLYAGMLHSYDFTSEGELQRIVLTSAARAELPAAPAAVAKFVAIQGDLFVVWCRDVNTLNIDYLHPAPAATHTHSVPPHHGSGRHGATP